MKNGTWIKVGSIPVDSGQMMLIDPCYIKNDFATEYDPKAKPDAKKLNYDGACAASLSKKQVGKFGGLAICASAGWGDGLYEVFVRYEDNRVAEMKIVFIDNND